MATAILEGQTLGRYRVLEALGRGGMARVYRGYHPQLDRYVAIKVLRPDLAEEEEFPARFQREARAVAALRHPNIVQVFDFDVQRGVYYMVMELLEGDTLKTRLNDLRVRGEKMALGEMTRVLLDVLAGLSYAHGEGMVHRDIKPANILLTKRGQAVLADFGIAHIVGGTRHTVSGALMGTLNYMAPEQGLNNQSDARSDIYSLGIVFYEMLTGRTPFEADTPLAILMKHINDPLPLPRSIDPSIPEPFERVVLKALAKRPEDRYQSAEDMARALRAAAEEAGVELPERVSLPLSFTMPGAPDESVAVFSGGTRDKIADATFSEGDTGELPAIGLAAEAAVHARHPQSLLGAGKELLNAASAALRQAVKMGEHRPTDRAPSGVLIGQADEGSAAPVAPPPGSFAEERRRRGSVATAILGAIGLVLLGNLGMLSLSASTGWWSLYAKGWPVELFLVSWGLCLIMYVASSIWLLIPVGIIFGTGSVIAYCAFTGHWDYWGFLWLLQVWVVFVSIAAPIVLARNKKLARWASRFLSVLIGLGCMMAIFYVALNSIPDARTYMWNLMRILGKWL